MGMKREAVQEERQRNKEKGEIDIDTSTGNLFKWTLISKTQLC